MRSCRPFERIPPVYRSASCHSVPQRIRDGIAGYQQLRVPLLLDGRVDPNQCLNLVFHVKASAKTAKEEGIEHLRREIGRATYERAML